MKNYLSAFTMVLLSIVALNAKSISSSRGQTLFGQTLTLRGTFFDSAQVNPDLAYPWSTHTFPTSNVVGKKMRVTDSAIRKAMADSLAAMKNWVASNDNVYTAGLGLIKTGVEPNAGFAVNTSSVMMVATAEDSIAALKLWFNNYYTKVQADARYLQSYTETDPIWMAAIPNYYTKSASDVRYLQNYTETDPLWTADKSSYYTKVNSDARYLQNYTETDPLWVAAMPNYYTKSAADARYLQSFTETDPTIGAHIKGITAVDTGHWNVAYRWGNHAGLYYPISGNPSGFLTISALAPYQTISGMSAYQTTAGMSIYQTVSGMSLYATNASLGGYVPTSRTFTINGYGGDLSASRSVTLSTGDIAESGNLYYTNTRSRASISVTGPGIAYNSATGLLTGSVPIILTTTGTGVATLVGSALNIPTPSVMPILPTIDTVTRPLNTSFTISCNWYVSVSYSVKMAVTLALTAITATANVQYSLDNGANYIPCPPVTYTPAALSLGALTSQTVNVSGLVPYNATNIKIVTVPVSGVTYSIVAGGGQEAKFNR